MDFLDPVQHTSANPQLPKLLSITTVYESVQSVTRLLLMELKGCFVAYLWHQYYSAAT